MASDRSRVSKQSYIDKRKEDEAKLQRQINESDAKRAAHASNVYGIIDQYAYGDMAPKQPSPVISIYDIEKERQAQRDAEKEKAKSDAGVYIASQNPNMFHPGSPTPSSQIENIDIRGAMHPSSEVYIPEEPKGLNRVSSAAPTPDVDESSANPSAQGDGDTDTSNESAQQPSNPYQDFAKLWQKPITPEEEARRERAARAVQGVAGLGNLMSAFANLTFTGKGAPSQTLPTQSVDNMGKDMTSWKDKLKAEREKYQAAELGAKVEQWKAELDAQHRAQQQANVDRAYNLQVQQHRDNMALAEAKARADAEQNQQRMALEQQRVSIARQEANTRLSEAQRKDKPYPMIVDGQLYEIPISRVNEQMIGSIFAKLPEEVRNSAGQPIYGEGYGKKTIVGYKNPSLSDMLAAIGTYGNEETAALIKGLAGVQNDDPAEDNNGFKDGGGRGSNATPSTVGSTNGVTNGWDPDNKNDDSPIKKKK